MSLFGTPTEKKRDTYYALYTELQSLSDEFSRKARVMEDKVSSYQLARLIIVGDYIPEDMFGSSEINVHTKVAAMKDNQLSVGKSLSNAASTAYDRYVYYRQLAIQEEIAREAERRERERRQQEASKNK